MADPSIILVCMVFWLYPWFHGPVLLIAMGFALAGAAIQLVLLRRTRKARWFPLLGAGIMAAVEVLYQLNQIHVISTIQGHDIWNYIGFGVVVLYVLFGTLIGWMISLAFDRLRAGSRTGQVP
jgi:hypothetical protein